jgi:hypothetical protein
MGTSNVNWKYSFTAAEDLSTAGHEGVAIALADNKVANSGEEADGILVSKPQSGENGTIVIQGIAKGRAGEALTAGMRLTVDTSGYLDAATSGDYHSAKALATITSGSLGPVYFHGANFYMVSSK